MQNDMLGFMQAKLLGNRRPNEVKHSSTEVAALFKIRLASAEYKSYEKKRVKSLPIMSYAQDIIDPHREA